MGFPIDNSNRPQLYAEQAPRTTPEQLRIMQLNVGGGYKNEPGNPDGMDPGDVDDLARRIAGEDVDVATLQEVWKGDVDELERKLEEITGDDWDLHFAAASEKRRWDDSVLGGGLFGLGGVALASSEQHFGNVVAVRYGNGIASSRLNDTLKLDRPEDDGSDGRVAMSVRVMTEDGSSIDIVTAHTDPDGVSTAERGEQIEDVRRFAENTAGWRPVIVTGDLNDSRGHDDAPSRALDSFVEDHGYTDAGEQVGATSNFGHGRAIDFIFTSGDIDVDPSQAQRVEGHSPDEPGEDRDLSDHDGIVVDIAFEPNRGEID